MTMTDSAAGKMASILKHVERPHLGMPPAQPFVKWVGGKRTTIPYLAPHFPDTIETYWEPFVGGGAVFFTFADRIKRAYLSDTNEELILTYKVIKDDVESLIEYLNVHRRKHMRRKKYADGNTYYGKVRDLEPQEPVEVAARFIYLNKTCYNGLYRVNKSGDFNVPEGKYENPMICDPERLRKCSAALRNTHIRLGDFAGVSPGPGDFVYCDPPYDGCFAQYQKSGFDAAEQARLQAVAAAWDKDGAKVVLSNADTEAMRDLYASWGIHEATAKRSVGQNVNSRKNAAELVITNG